MACDGSNFYSCNIPDTGPALAHPVAALATTSDMDN